MAVAVAGGGGARAMSCFGFDLACYGYAGYVFSAYNLCGSRVWNGRW